MIFGRVMVVVVALPMITATFAACPGAAAPPPPVERVILPSPEPSGIPVNDRIPVTYYAPATLGGASTPAVVMLHPIGSDEGNPLMVRFAKRVARDGIGCALMALPYHGTRIPAGEQAGGRFTDEDPQRVVQAYGQAASDVSTVTTWLGQRPGIDPHKLGVVGVSLGAIIAHLAMGKDARLVAGAAILGSGDLTDLRRSSLLPRVIHRHYSGKPVPEAAVAALRSVDPLTFAGQNVPRHVLMIQAARDLLVLPRDATELWNALGRPPIRWVDTNHFALGITPDSTFRACEQYLRRIWAGTPDAGHNLPKVYAPTLKFGMVAGAGVILSPAVQWQAYSFFSRRDHMSLLHADLGLNYRGPFLGLAATVNPFVDVGVARRFFGSGILPYASFHVVF